MAETLATIDPNNCSPAEVFPPGEFIRDELDARGWTQDLFAQIIGRQPSEVNRIIAGKTAITPDTARAIAAAFGTTPQLWLNLESSYQLWKSQNADAHSETNIKRKARVYDYAPVAEMIKRRWIEESEKVEVLERRVCDFFGVPSLDDEPQLAAAARKSTSYQSHNKAQLAWLCRAKRLARAVQAAEFKHAHFVNQLQTLRRLAADVENVRLVSKRLAELGVRLIVVEPLAKTRIDGAVIWTEFGPVIALSMRFDRLDAFWHTVVHEATHIKNKDGDSLDVGIVADASGNNVEKELPDAEVRANAEGAHLLIPSPDLESFASRHNRRISEDAIIRFANKIAIHPGIIVGQLHHRGALPYTHLRKFLMQGQVRNMVIESSVTDGWGITPDVF